MSTSPYAAEATGTKSEGFVGRRRLQRTGRRPATRLSLAAAAAACLVAGVVGGCADRSADPGGGQGRPGGPAESSIRDARSSSDQLYGTYGRVARERGGY